MVYLLQCGINGAEDRYIKFFKSIFEELILAFRHGRQGIKLNEVSMSECLLASEPVFS